MSMPIEPLQTTPMRAAESNARPRFELPPGSCDTHFHVFEPGYAHVPEPLYTFPDATLDQYLDVAKHLGIERMVLVQPTFYGTDNTLALHVLRRVGPAARAVVRVEEEVSDAELDSMHDLGVRAIRLDLFARAQLPTAEIIAYVRRMARRTAPRGWHLQFYAPGWVVRDLLPFLADFREGRCWIKLSGPYRIAGDKPMSTLQELGRTLVETRVDRLIWGSDWPHLPDGQRDTGELLELLADWAPDGRDRHRILVGGPDELFFAP
jgi:2-pyrone-4,6-dicarboxylate lactonase